MPGFIKPCPFCGLEPEEVSAAGTKLSDTYFTARILCPDECCEGPLADAQTASGAMSAAIELWNKRV